MKANQIDYHDRILDWFGHYLQGGKAPAWIDQGRDGARSGERAEAAKKDEGK